MSEIQQKPGKLAATMAALTLASGAAGYNSARGDDGLSTLSGPDSKTWTDPNASTKPSIDLHGKFITVQPGSSWWQIAAAEYGSGKEYPRIENAPENRFEREHGLHANDKVFVPDLVAVSAAPTAPTTISVTAPALQAKVLVETTRPVVSDGVTITVQKGDSLWKIAARQYGRGELYAAIEKAPENAAVMRKGLHPGDKVFVPAVASADAVEECSPRASATEATTLPVTRPSAERPYNERGFQIALAHLLREEGGVSKDANDHGNAGGNATNHGVTQAAFDGFNKRHHVDPHSTTTITPKEIEAFYRECWDRMNCSQYPLRTGIVLFDMGVQHGDHKANQLLQRAAAHLGVSEHLLIDPHTVNAEQEPKLLDALFAVRQDFYTAIVKHDPSQKIYEKGWKNNRVDGLRAFVNGVPEVSSTTQP